MWTVVGESSIQKRNAARFFYGKFLSLPCTKKDFLSFVERMNRLGYVFYHEIDTRRLNREDTIIYDLIESKYGRILTNMSAFVSLAY